MRNIRKTTTILICFTLLVGGSGLFSPAQADSWWNVFGSFRVGGVHFSVGYHQPTYGAHRYYPGRYYRTHQHFKYRGQRCGAYCYTRDKYRYHHESCPLLGAHFRSNGYAPSYDRYDRYDRYSRYDDGHHYKSHKYYKPYKYKKHQHRYDHRGRRYCNDRDQRNHRHH